jgi:hypothetical protein
MIPEAAVAMLACARIGAAKVGNKNRLGLSFTEASKRQISESLRGKTLSAETRAKLSAARKGVPKSPEWCEKMRAIHKGRVISTEQRAQISALKSQVVTDRAALDAARAELELWKDPDYVKSQARERLHFVLPGERQYIVTGTKDDPTLPDTTKVVSQLPEGAPWYTKLIASVTESGL